MNNYQLLNVVIYINDPLTLKSFTLVLTKDFINPMVPSFSAICSQRVLIYVPLEQVTVK